MTIRKANAEQLTAIKRDAGALLSAGAGSGKTFVIVDHVLNLLYENESIKNIGVMTFTEKASREIVVRFKKRIKDLMDESFIANKTKELETWASVQKRLRNISITTIDGFCLRFLMDNFKNQLAGEIKVISELEHREKIKSLFNDWFTQLVDNREVDQVSADYNSYRSAALSIFSSPELRIDWKNSSQKNAPISISNFIKSWAILNSVDQLCKYSSEVVTILEADSSSSQKWRESILEMAKKIGEFGELDDKNFHDYVLMTNELKRFPTLPKSLDSDVILTFANDMRNLRELIKEYSNDILLNIEHQEELLKWHTTLSSMFKYIDKNYLKVPGLYFSDIEYYTWSFLSEGHVELVPYYLVVDEFQDTSKLQYEIIKKLTNHQPKRLFAVGDRKQAIYGFRGGEISVFDDCEKSIEKEGRLNLRINFRSEPEIVNFNNLFFKWLLPLGPEYSGHDINQIHIEDQLVPEGKNSLGSININKVLIQNEKIIDDHGLELIEAHSVFSQITKLLEDKKNIKNIACLYSKLGPSKHLINLLNNSEIFYQVQIKIKLSEDFVFILFYRSVEFLINKEFASLEKSNNSIEFISLLLHSYGIELSVVIEFEQFFENKKLYGLKIAWNLLWWKFKIKNEQFENNEYLIDAICDICKDDILEVYHLIETNLDEKISINEKRGSDVVLNIMTAHASKGLEFDAVILSGISTNGRTYPFKEVIGKEPDSFRWSFIDPLSNTKKKVKSLGYILEQKRQLLLNFSEQKRLLYVAATRSVKKLFWTEIFFNEELKYQYPNSWVNALHKYSYENAERETISIDENNFKKDKNKKIKRKKIVFNPEQADQIYGIFSELSVTKLTTLEVCPHKFYLQNIIKLSEKDLIIQKNSEIQKTSSMERGTKLHFKLSKLIVGNKLIADLNLIKIHTSQKVIVQNVFLKLKEMSSITDQFISEQEIKFSIFGPMITGTADLIIANEERLIIVDYKTGASQSDLVDSYWMQLKLYAYAVLQKKKFESIKLILWYIDENFLVEKNISSNEIIEDVYNLVVKSTKLSLKNKNHCNECEYQYACI